MLWENFNLEKKSGSFGHRGLRYDFLRKKIWTIPLILQFNIQTLMLKSYKRMDWMGSLKAPLLEVPLCGANKKSQASYSPLLMESMVKFSKPLI